MSSVNKSVLVGLLLISGLFFLGGCGSSESNESPFSPEDQQHPAGWLPAGHVLSAKADITVCADCHGEDYSGGISHISCSQCHLGGVNSVHPLAWGQQTDTLHGFYAASYGNTACASAFCHGTNLTGVTDSGPSCSSCHLGGPTSVHPLDWTPDNIFDMHSTYVSVNSDSSCRNAACHGINLLGVQNSGPSCSACHAYP